jgi:valyl-tRNA synthetase
MRLLIPLAGLVDMAEERARIEKLLDRELNGLEQAERKLANERFVANAPAEVVDKERSRMAEHRRKAEELQAQLQLLARAG